jgi:cellulose synthase/poly-beta-1,6-N-acetylglucosamine synthase-like glycosyltransferase
LLSVGGVIILSIYLIPFILRPLDFLKNMRLYFQGFIAYFLMLPVYLNIMQVYSMSNLHDVSWGNRPSAANAGTEALAVNAKTQ